MVSIHILKFVIMLADYKEVHILSQMMKPGGHVHSCMKAYLFQLLFLQCFHVISKVSFSIDTSYNARAAHTCEYFY